MPCPGGVSVAVNVGGTASGELSAMLSMGSYLSLSSKLLFAFGLIFELPIVIFFLAQKHFIQGVTLTGIKG